MTARLSPTLKGLLFSTLTFALFSTNDAIMKALSRDIAVPQLLMTNYGLVAFLILLWSLIKQRGDVRTLFRFEKPRWHLVRGLVHAAGVGCLITGFSRLPMADVYVLLFMAPLLIAFFSAFILRERISLHLVVVLGVSFAGIIIAFRPSGLLNPDVLIAFLGVLGYVASILIMRYLAQSNSARAIMFSVNVLAASCLAVPTFFLFREVNALQAGLLFVTALSSITSYALFIKACRLAPAALVSVPQFLQLIYGAVAGYVVFGDAPASSVYLGGALVIAANVYLLVVQRRKAATPSSAPERH